MEVKIRQVSNGYVVTWEEDYLDGGGSFTKDMLFIDDSMYEAGDTCFKPITDVFNTVLELFDRFGSKHNKKHNPVVRCTCEGKSWYEELQEDDDVE